MSKSNSFATIGDGHTLILPCELAGGEGRFAIIHNVEMTGHNLTIGAAIMDMTELGDSSPRRRPGSMGPVSGTISFTGFGMELTDYNITERPLIEEYTIIDMLRIIRQKIKER